MVKYRYKRKPHDVVTAHQYTQDEIDAVLPAVLVFPEGHEDTVIVAGSWRVTDKYHFHSLYSDRQFLEEFEPVQNPQGSRGSRWALASTEPKILKMAREVVADPAYRPSYCQDPEDFMPHGWVIELVRRAKRERDDAAVFVMKDLVVEIQRLVANMENS